MKTDEMNFHMGSAKFHLLSESRGSPQSIPVRVTGMCRICELLFHSANWQTAPCAGIRGNGRQVCLWEYEGGFPSPSPLPFHFHSLFFAGLPPSIFSGSLCNLKHYNALKSFILIFYFHKLHLKKEILKCSTYVPYVVS